MFACAEVDLLAGLREEQGSAQREKLQVWRQTDGSRRFGMLQLGTRINAASTHGAATSYQLFQAPLAPCVNTW